MIHNMICKGQPACVIIWPTFDFRENETEHLLQELEKAGVQDFALVPVKAKDWDHDFSPWVAPKADGSGDFGGGGPQTLRWIREELMPEIRASLQAPLPVYIAGYSLAGLFALWSMYECQEFSGAVCCSPSVWYEGWDDFAKSKGIQTADSRIYLSLGGKEEKTPNAMMARVGTRIRDQEKLLKADSNVAWCRLEWNSGGHFADSGKRLAKGIAQIMKR